MTSEHFNPERLTLGRLRRGLNKTKLAETVGVKAPTITAYENATREPPLEMVGKLANALGFPVPFFFSEMNDVVPVDAASFRSLSRMTAAQRNAAHASGVLAVELNDWIENEFELPTPDIPALDRGGESPAVAAAHVRARWGLGALPLANVMHTLEAHGVRIYALPSRYHEVDAFSFWYEAHDTPFIIIGTHKTPERQVFDLAHELGHLVLHRKDGQPRGREEEREADKFASHFLMPHDDLIVAAPRNPTLGELAVAKHRWKVSVAALAFRMNRMKLLSDWNYHTICVQLSTIGRHQEMNSLPREQSQVLAKVLVATRAQGKGRKDIAAALNVYQADVDALLDGLVLGAVDGDGTEVGGTPRPNLKLVR